MNERIEYKELKKRERDIQKCMKCGFCTSMCPIYNEVKNEAMVARGRNVFLKELMDGKIEMTDELFERFNMCLLCKRCLLVCPAKVPVDELVMAARADMVEKKGLPIEKKIVFKGLIQHRSLFGKVVKVASYLQYLLPSKKRGEVRHLPEFLTALGKGRHIPSIASKFGREIIPEVSPPYPGVEKRGTVGFFMGCAMDFIFPHIAKKIVDYLNRLGYEVITPREQGCCGAPVYMTGDFETGRVLADKNARCFEGLDIVVTGCATCGSALKDYPKYLADTPEREKLYSEFSRKMRDFSEFLVRDVGIKEEDLGTNPEVKGKRVTWHDPCHLIRHQNISEEPRKIIKSLDVEFIEMPGADMCCGMAGSFSLYHYDISMKIADRKAESIKSTGADIIVTSCPGCMIQFIDVTNKKNMPQRVMHLAQLLD